MLCTLSRTHTKHQATPSHHSFCLLLLHSTLCVWYLFHCYGILSVSLSRNSHSKKCALIHPNTHNSSMPCHRVSAEYSLCVCVLTNIHRNAPDSARVALACECVLFVCLYMIQHTFDQSTHFIHIQIHLHCIYTNTHMLARSLTCSHTVQCSHL